MLEPTNMSTEGRSRMRAERLITLVAGGVVGLVGTQLLATQPAFAAPGTPLGASAARAADNPYRIQVTWKPVSGADHYAVDLNDGTVDTITVLPASVTSITLDAPDPC